MTRCLFGVTCAAIVLPAFAVSVSTARDDRVLTDHELWAMFGGSQHANSCCVENSACVGTSYECDNSGAYDEEGCEGPPTAPNKEDEEQMVSNKEACYGTYPGKTCTQADTFSDCLLIWECNWTGSVCEPNPFSKVAIPVPDSCLANCD